MNQSRKVNDITEKTIIENIIKFQKVEFETKFWEVKNCVKEVITVLPPIKEVMDRIDKFCFENGLSFLRTQVSQTKSKKTASKKSGRRVVVECRRWDETEDISCLQSGHRSVLIDKTKGASVKMDRVTRSTYDSQTIIDSFNEKEEEPGQAEPHLDESTVIRTVSFENELNSSLVWNSPACRKQSANCGYVNQRSEQINRYNQQDVKSKSQKRFLVKGIPLTDMLANELDLLKEPSPTFFKFISSRSEVAPNIPKESHWFSEVLPKKEDSLTILDVQIMRSLKKLEGNIDRSISRFEFGKKEFQTDARKTKSLIYAFYSDTKEILKNTYKEEKKTKLLDFASQKLIFRQF